jgi:hypothetical protein
VNKLLNDNHIDHFPPRLQAFFALGFSAGPQVNHVAESENQTRRIIRNFDIKTSFISSFPDQPTRSHLSPTYA